jgi:flavin-dependent amine oxidoreductase
MAAEGQIARRVDGLAKEDEMPGGLGSPLDSWVDDPWVHGSYAGFAPGQYTDFWGFLEKREGNALFAGERTSTYIQGLPERGRREWRTSRPPGAEHAGLGTERGLCHESAQA